MQTKLSRYAEGIMEAAWLVALIVVPVFFNVYSSRIFEPDKLTLMRSLALLVLAAWLVKLVDGGGIHWTNVENIKSGWRKFFSIPLGWQVLALAVVYVISNLFSVTPRVSFWGSYQRLQGTYTTISYLVIFAALVGNLRSRNQVERLISTVIISSLPIGLYGILQKFSIDPVPWGGDVSVRIAANMGNAIFVAAYLIMVIPLTIGRLLDSFRAILSEDEKLSWHVARGTAYVFILAVQAIALFFSASRGPALGFLAGIFTLFLLLSVYLRKRWLTGVIVGISLAIAGFLILLNISGGPLEQIRTSSTFGQRFGSIFKLDSGTGLVRILIWDGAVEMVSPHDPLEFPDGSLDKYNFLRPVIGYGPESMYVAYNPFYPPQLASVESRNASPDRSHNETWDSLVITGGLGLLAYLAVFASVFYYGLNWLGFINTPGQRNLFFALFFGGGLVSVGIFISRFGMGFFGIGLPFGMLMGFLAYISFMALFMPDKLIRTSGYDSRWLFLSVLIAAITAHFVEIHFGIAIAATRTYFWVYTALLLLVGYILPKSNVYSVAAGMLDASGGLKAEVQESENQRKRDKRKKSRNRPTRSKRGGQESWMSEAWLGGLIISVILSSLGYDFISNTTQSLSALELVWKSFTTLPNQNLATSFGVLALLITSMIAAVITFASESATRTPETVPWGKFTILMLSATLTMTFIFWFWHATSLVNLGVFAAGVEPTIVAQAVRLEGLLTKYYIFLFIVIFIIAGLLNKEWPHSMLGSSGASLIAVPVALIIVFGLVNVTNLKVIHADISFKMAEPFARGGPADQWELAVQLYQRATSLAPSEDHYYLFLGRAYLELARLVDTPEESQRWMEQADEDLKRAQEINPLNTDHTANLARLYRVWASLDSERSETLGQISSDYYQRAVRLSPQNTTIWNEWAVLYLSVLNDPDQALATLEHSLEVDPNYDSTYAILADYYAQKARRSEDPEIRAQAFEQAATHYQEALNLIGKGNKTRSVRYNYWAALGGVYAENGELDLALAAYMEVRDLATLDQRWRVDDTIARVYIQLGDNENAMIFAQAALENAPEDQKSRIQDLVGYIQAQLNTP